MLGPPVLLVLVAAAALSSPAATQAVAPQPSASPVQESEKPWPPPGVVRAGAGVVVPRLIKESHPTYTAQAMQERIVGVVKMEAVVETDGTVGEVRVTKSLDREFGLDDKAAQTLKKWLFAPGRKDDIVVPVLIEVEMSFTLRK